MRKLSLIVLILLVSPAAAPAEWTFDARFRWESNDAPSGNPAADQDFDFSHLRARVGVDLKGKRWSFHAVAQGAGSFSLPENGSFGIGPVYFGANLGDDSPTDFGFPELDVAYEGERFFAKLGRQKWSDGTETMTGVAYLDGVKRRRMGERLIGNWDWVNAGRRYQGLSAGWKGEALHFAAFGFEPLQGGVNYQSAFDDFDGDLSLAGATLTGRYGHTLKSAEWRLFGIEFEDERLPARTTAGAPIEITTLGGSLLLGNERGDVLLWYAFQTGDWGVVDHDASAYVVEAGRKLLDGPTQISGRLGVAEASGDGDAAGDHETFFNLLPTNHKWYGAIDFSAFSNLRNYYFDAVLSRGRLTLGLGVHRFELPERADAWYGGSGAFNLAALGYAARRPAGGRFDDDTIGHEIDAALGWKLGNGLKLDGGVSYFDGGAAAEEILTMDADGTWAWVQMSWSR